MSKIHRHHRRNTEEYINEMQELDEKDHIEKEPDIDLDSILSNRHTSALRMVFGIKKSENDLKKGSLQRKLPFNPKTPENQAVTTKQRQWTHDEEDDSRQAIPKMEGSPRIRALNKLAAKTHVRKHPETGERLFLMHRGIGGDAGGESQYHKKGTANYPSGTKTSWTPDYEVADSFGGNPASGGSTISAWIPESSIVHSINQFNTPTDRSLQEAKMLPKSGKTHTKGSRSVTEREENEWIVHHTQPFHHANMDALVDIDSKISNKKINDKSAYKAKSLKQLKNPDTHQGQYGWMGNEPKKLAASEKDTIVDLNKTLEAGSGNVAPSNLTGGAALQKESLSNDLQKPFKSKKQRRYAYANLEEFGGKQGIKEWESKTPENIPESVEKKDKIPGGLADKKKPSDFDKKKLKQGVKVESEHTSDKEIAREIAMDHLTEDKDYYKKLKTIEKSEFLRRGVLLATIGAGMQHLHNQSVEDAKPIRREIASAVTERPPTEPEKSYNAAQKDAFTIAAKHLPLSRNLARQTIKDSPELSEAHGYVMHLSPSAYKEVIASNPQIKQDVAAYHYDKLHELHGGDQNKIFEDYKNRAKNIQKSTTSEK